MILRIIAGIIGLLGCVSAIWLGAADENSLGDFLGYIVFVALFLGYAIGGKPLLRKIAPRLVEDDPLTKWERRGRSRTPHANMEEEDTQRTSATSFTDEGASLRLQHQIVVQSRHVMTQYAQLKRSCVAGVVGLFPRHIGGLVWLDGHLGCCADAP